MQAAPARRPYGVLPPDGTDAAHRVGMEVRLRTAHTRHRYPVWRNSSRGGVSDTRFPYGGLPPEGTESCLRTVRMRHRSPAWRESSRRSAPDASRPLPVSCNITRHQYMSRKQCWYRCKIVMSSLGTSSPNYRGVMRFIGGAHDPKYNNDTYILSDIKGK